MLRLLFAARPAFRALWWVSLGFLVFVAGAATYHFELPPGSWLRGPLTGADAWLAQRRALQSDYPWMFYRPARTGSRGVTLHDAARSYGDFTLVLEPYRFEALLLAPDGTEIHRWRPEHQRLWTSAAGGPLPFSEELVYLRRGHLYPNGDVLLLLAARNQTPWGVALVKLDADSRLQWIYRGNTHHDLSVAPDGRIFVLTHHIRQDPLPGIGWPPPILEDFVVELSPEGRELGRTSVPLALRPSPFAHVLNLNRADPDGDFLHTNAVRYIDAATAQRFPFAREGQVLVALRHTDGLFLLDLTRQQATWGLFGPWRAAHDPDLLDNGNILIFDNRGHLGPGGCSRVLELNPATMAIEWQYDGTPEQPLHSLIRSWQQRLANGNTFIVESDQGRLLEVSPDEDIVWEYYVPARHGPKQEMIPAITWAQRYACSELDDGFRGRLEAAGGSCR